MTDDQILDIARIAAKNINAKIDSLLLKYNENHDEAGRFSAGGGSALATRETLELDRPKVEAWDKQLKEEIERKKRERENKKSATLDKYAPEPEDFEADWIAEDSGDNGPCPGCEEAANGGPYDNPYDVPDPSSVCFAMNGVGKNDSECNCVIVVNDEEIDAVDFNPTSYDVSDDTEKSALLKGGAGSGNFGHGGRPGEVGGSSEGGSPADAIKEFESTYPVNPFYERESIINNHSAVELKVWEGKLMIDSIRSLEPGKGYGSEALKTILALADKHGIPVTLHAKAFGTWPEKRLSTAKLKAWYQRYGFVRVSGYAGMGYHMERPAQVKKMVTKGGAGSGNFGHAGRIGEVGGSSEGGGASVATSERSGEGKITTIADAIERLGNGQGVQFEKPAQAVTLLHELARMAQEAKAQGKEAKDYDLCKVSVQGTNLFCNHNMGIPRSQMPQLSGKPLPGSLADKLEKDAKGEVNLGPAFKDYLAANGHTVTSTNEFADRLRASQREMNGAKVGGMLGALDAGKLPSAPIFISKENYVIDGHHRYAANVAHSYEHIGSRMKMPVERIDMSILEALQAANDFANMMGIPQQGLSKAAIAALLKGGAGSGNFGHSGRVGEVGGSGAGGGGGRMGAAQRRTAAENRAQRGVSQRVADRLDARAKVEVTNGRGGFDKYEMKPSTNYSNVNAWISPKGEFFPVYTDEHGKLAMEMDHTAVAGYLGDDTGGEKLDRLGWIHMSDSIGIQFNADRSPTDAQAKVMDKFFTNWQKKEPQGGFGTNADYKSYYSDWMNIEGNMKAAKLTKGGAGSGNFGHEGRPGEVGGSAIGGGEHSFDLKGAPNPKQFTNAEKTASAKGITFRTGVGADGKPIPTTGHISAEMQANLQAHAMMDPVRQERAIKIYQDYHNIAVSQMPNVSPQVACAMVAVCSQNSMMGPTTSGASPTIDIAVNTYSALERNESFTVTAEKASTNATDGHLAFPSMDSDGHDVDEPMKPGTYKLSELAPTTAARFIGAGLCDPVSQSVRMYRGESPNKVISSPKLRNFATNIALPQDARSVTVDRWAARSALIGPRTSFVQREEDTAKGIKGVDEAETWRGSSGNAPYAILAENIDYFASHNALNADGSSRNVLPLQAQAITWPGSNAYQYDFTKYDLTATKVADLSKGGLFPLNPFANPGPDEVSDEDAADDAAIAARFGLAQTIPIAVQISKSAGKLDRTIERLRPLRKERGVVINAKGMIVWEEDGGHDFVPLKGLEHKDIEGATFLHNHPSGVAPSVDDIGSACALRLSAVYAIGKTGYTYCVEPPEGHDTFEPDMWPDIDRAGRAADDAVREEYAKMLKAGDVDPDEANIEHWNVVNEAVAEACGLRYRRIGKGHYDLPQIKAEHSSHIPVYDKNGVSPNYPTSKKLSAEANATFSSLYEAQTEDTHGN